MPEQDGKPAMRSKSTSAQYRRPTSITSTAAVPAVPVRAQQKEQPLEAQQPKTRPFNGSCIPRPMDRVRAFMPDDA